MNKLEQIVKIISTMNIGNQIQLREELLSIGIDTTQSSISRDLRKLNAKKVNGFYRVKVPLQKLTQVYAGANISSCDGGLIVIKSGPGTANHIGYLIDQADIAGIVGTIAGDDSIFIAVRNLEDREPILEELSELLNL